jgi:hypothetical protein
MLSTGMKMDTGIQPARSVFVRYLNTNRKKSNFFSRRNWPSEAMIKSMFRMRDPVSFDLRDPGWVNNQDPDPG